MTMVEQALKRNRRQQKNENSEEIEALIRQLTDRCKSLSRRGRLNEAILFGSVLHPRFFHENSDVDIALGGVSPDDSWALTSELARVVDRELDVQFLEDVPKQWRDNIRDEGIQLL